MIEPDWKAPLEAAHDLALGYLTGLPGRNLATGATFEQLRRSLGGGLPEQPQDAADVVAELAAAVEPGLHASGSGRYFGFVVGGATPAAIAADWLTSVWDQNAGLYVMGPAAAVVEDVTGAWLADLLGLPAGVSVGFVTGAQAANTTGLAIGLRQVLARAGWDLDSQGLWGAPRPPVLVGAGRHGTVDRALRLLGIGTAGTVAVDVDDQGRMLLPALAEALAAADGPVLVCAQAGNVNSGSTDPLRGVCELVHEHGGWVHVDGAFGLWAGASPGRRHLVDGVELADSWGTDAHKWLNVPYDSGLVFCADPAAHRATMGIRSGYLIQSAGEERDGLDYGPEHSRRARGFAVHAALRALGRSGVVELIDRCCAMATLFAEQLAAEPGIEVLNDVVLNQVLVRFGDSDELTRQVVARVQQEGTCWLSGSVWQGRAVMRISVSNWSTDEADVLRSVAAILRCAQESATGSATGSATHVRAD